MAIRELASAPDSRIWLPTPPESARRSATQNAEAGLGGALAQGQRRHCPDLVGWGDHTLEGMAPRVRGVVFDGEANYGISHIGEFRALLLPRRAADPGSPMNHSWVHH